jgi:hypothetical protein
VVTLVQGEGRPSSSISWARKRTAVCQFSRVQKSLKSENISSDISQVKNNILELKENCCLPVLSRTKITEKHFISH